MLALEAIVVRRGDTTLLDAVTLSAAEHELLAVVGPSGAGKSTLLRAIAGLERVAAGTVRLAGEDVTGTPPERRRVAMVFQSFALFPHLTAAENIGFGLRARGMPVTERRSRISEVAARLGLEPLLDRRPAQLSGGERQRVALARGLAGRPRLLLLDEPLANLDLPLRAQARAELRRIQREEGVTVVHVTHDQHEALVLGHRVAVLRAGQVLQAGTPDEIYERPASAFVGAFVGDPPMALLPARIEGDDVAAGAIRVAGVAGRTRGREAVTLGVRPEAVRIDQAGSGAVVEAVERAGHATLVHLAAGELRFAARPGSPVGNLVAGDEVAVTVDPAGARLFDPVTGAAV